jgi:serine/threonine protein phosphatase 1
MLNTYVIGDIHGNIVELRKLINQIKDGQLYIFLGDYIDKNEFVKETIDFLIDFSIFNKCIFLMGNHEYKFFRCDLNFIRKYGIQTFESYLRTNIRNYNMINSDTIKDVFDVMYEEKHLNFFTNNLCLYYQIDNYYCFHAGYNPEYKNLNDLLLNDPESILFSRFDFISSKCLLDGKKIIFGHTSFETVCVDNYKIGIDTGSAYGGPITAFCIDHEFFINSYGEKKYLNEMGNKGVKIFE